MAAALDLVGSFLVGRYPEGLAGSEADRHGHREAGALLEVRLEGHLAREDHLSQAGMESDVRPQCRVSSSVLVRMGSAGRMEREIGTSGSARSGAGGGHREGS